MTDTNVEHELPEEVNNALYSKTIPKTDGFLLYQAYIEACLNMDYKLRVRLKGLGFINRNEQVLWCIAHNIY